MDPLYHELDHELNRAVDNLLMRRRLERAGLSRTRSYHFASSLLLTDMQAPILHSSNHARLALCGVAHLHALGFRVLLSASLPRILNQMLFLSK